MSQRDEGLDKEDSFIPAGIMTVDQIGTNKQVPARLTKKFEPKTWKPKYDLFVYWHCLGWSNKKIAEEFDFTPQQVCNILTSNQGKLRIKLIEENLREARTAGVSSRVEDMAAKLLRRMEDVVDNDSLFEKAPFAVFDRALAVIKGIGYLKGEGMSHPYSGSSTVNHTQINDNRHITNIFSAKALNELREAISFSREASAMHEHLLKPVTDDKSIDSEDKKVLVGTIQPPISAKKTG